MNDGRRRCRAERDLHDQGRALRSLCAADLEPSPALTIDAGLRYEITRRQVSSGRPSAAPPTTRSRSIRRSTSAMRRRPADQFRASIARTVRRPDYDLISPLRAGREPGRRRHHVGNPALKNERAWGVDVGYERRLGGSGIFGVNFFYRDIKRSDRAGRDRRQWRAASIFTPRNIGDGKTWGFELDFSAPLDVLGLPDTGLFANYTYLDSSTRDPFTARSAGSTTSRIMSTMSASSRPCAASMRASARPFPAAARRSNPISTRRSIYATIPISKRSSKSGSARISCCAFRSRTFSAQQEGGFPQI